MFTSYDNFTRNRYCTLGIPEKKTGTAVLLFMISDLLHKACVIGADALDAARHNREKRVNACCCT